MVNIFDWRVPVPGLTITMHGWTLLTLIALWICTLIKTRTLREWSPVVATAGVTVSIHLYESTHGLCQLVFDGSVGPVEINLACLFGTLAFLYIFNKSTRVLSNISTVVIPFLLFILSMGVLVSMGFFVNYPYNTVKGVEWALSKVAASAATLSLFWRKDYGQLVGNNTLLVNKNKHDGSMWVDDRVAVNESYKKTQKNHRLLV